MNRGAVVVELDAIGAAYGRARALSGISMQLRHGERLFLLGENGAGKTTLLRTIAGLHEPNRGTVHYFDGVLSHNRAHQLARAGVSFVRERAPIMGSLSVRENIALGDRLAQRRGTKVGSDSPMDLATEWFEVLGSKANQRADTLSGGQRQLLALASALVSFPRLLLLDEPSTGLSLIMIERLFEVILSFENREHGLTTLVTEQDARVAGRYASRLAWLDHGHFHGDGPPHGGMSASPNLLTAS